ncbi:MAG: hypothetical protein MRY72_13030 [Aquisalinus sp.]|nr:hypothetical protein [Aquisalinus sp.]
MQVAVTLAIKAWHATTAVAAAAGTAIYSTGGAVAGALGSIGAGGAAAGTAGASGAGAASTAAAAGKGLTALNILDGSITAFSAYAGYAQGQAAKAQAEEQAFIAETEARGDLIRGRQEGNDILDAANTRIARTITAFGNAGVEINSGSASRVIGNLARQTEEDVGQVDENAVLSARVRRSNARSLRRQGRRAGLIGLVNAGVTTGQGAIRIRERG